MATTVVIEGQAYLKRSPIGVIGLTLITLGIYGLVWYYKINDEARRYLKDDSIKPGIALLAVLLGWVVIVPPFISIYRTGERIVRIEREAGVANEMSPALFLILFVIVGFLGAAYAQEHLNRSWDRASVTRMPPPPGVAPAPEVPPMPGT